MSTITAADLDRAFSESRDLPASGNRSCSAAEGGSPRPDVTAYATERLEGSRAVLGILSGLALVFLVAAVVGVVTALVQAGILS